MRRTSENLTPLHVGLGRSGGLLGSDDSEKRDTHRVLYGQPSQTFLRARLRDTGLGLVHDRPAKAEVHGLPREQSCSAAAPDTLARCRRQHGPGDWRND